MVCFWMRFRERDLYMDFSKNMDPDLQAKNVRRVKKYESGVLQEPVTVGPYTSIQEVIDLTRQKNISGVPVGDIFR